MNRSWSLSILPPEQLVFDALAVIRGKLGREDLEAVENIIGELADRVCNMEREAQMGLSHISWRR